METLSTSSNNSTKTNKEAANFTNPLELLDDTTLQEQLCQFFCGVRKSGKKEYAPSSLHVGFAAIARGLSDIFYPNRIINIHDKHKWK
ncbi:unnamed protein product [Rhizophagus irregularis]|nr:unnamed protein product [Rhizophagus irregularis]CAB5363767.1 unnamed protein product [Rhizophagus irregularis]